VIAALGVVVLVAVQTAALDLLQSAADPNPALRSYVATATLIARLHPLPLRKTFIGTAYYVKPTRKIVFADVPGPLSRFRTLATTTPSYAEAAATYSIAPLGDDGTFSTYQLVPKKSGTNVTDLVLTVDDKAALITHAVWHYRNGGALSFDEHYRTIGPFRLQSSIDITARFTGYSVDATIDFGDYRTNVEVSPAVFAR
jgi:hypothetical protein